MKNGLCELWCEKNALPLWKRKFKSTTHYIIMAGIYVHVPFCKTRCIYCGFFSTTSMNLMPKYVETVLCELHERRDYLKGQTVETLYFGGGTPSQLPVAALRRIIDAVHIIYKDSAACEAMDEAACERNAMSKEQNEANVEGRVVNEQHVASRKFLEEVTVEANPDDITPEWLEAVKDAGVNRLSIGVQTFNDDRLRLIRRRHTSIQAVQAVRMAQDAGFDNVSIDLMFGFPEQTLAEWQSDLDHAVSLGVQHLSAYSLMYEDGTPLARMLDAGQINEIDDELSLAMFERLVDVASSAGYRHYEISNFALPGRESRHNSSYWHGVPYLGVGPGAHSSSGTQRCYNSDSLTEYIAGSKPVLETLTELERYDEYVFTRLRTAEGIDIADMERTFGSMAVAKLLSDSASQVSRGMLVYDGIALRLSRRGIFVSNDIMSDLMAVED